MPNNFKYLKTWGRTNENESDLQKEMKMRKTLYTHKLINLTSLFINQCIYSKYYLTKASTD